MGNEVKRCQCCHASINFFSQFAYVPEEQMPRTSKDSNCVVFCERLSHTCNSRDHTKQLYLNECNASFNSSSAHPPPGNSGAFSRTFHPGGRALGLISLPSNYPGAFDHPTFFHLTTLSFLLMTISAANTVSFFLNTSR